MIPAFVAAFGGSHNGMNLMIRISCAELSRLSSHGLCERSTPRLVFSGLERSKVNTAANLWLVGTVQQAGFDKFCMGQQIPTPVGRYFRPQPS